ncbi:hypothetical protein HYC85_005478 [Camellia sinensis]|uniref:DUF8204 domain-containing protein n=1 Tax=Camellia sinensis TaxID=4442 RepID=A0A7J7HZL7_CAMSI|nr:hypothetical protein HYC85_005478 [Camellia sinensis]
MYAPTLFLPLALAWSKVWVAASVQSPVVVNMLLPELRMASVPRHIVGESEVDASREGRSLAEFKYACVGYSVYSNGKDPTADVQETQAELPVLYDKKVNAADSVPAHVHSREGNLFRFRNAKSKVRSLV